MSVQISSRRENLKQAAFILTASFLPVVSKGEGDADLSEKQKNLIGSIDSWLSDLNKDLSEGELSASKAERLDDFSERYKLLKERLTATEGELSDKQYQALRDSWKEANKLKSDGKSDARDLEKIQMKQDYFDRLVAIYDKNQESEAESSSEDLNTDSLKSRLISLQQSEFDSFANELSGRSFSLVDRWRSIGSSSELTARMTTFDRRFRPFARKQGNIHRLLDYHQDASSLRFYAELPSDDPLRVNTNQEYKQEIEAFLLRYAVGEESNTNANTLIYNLEIAEEQSVGGFDLLTADLASGIRKKFLPVSLTITGLFALSFFGKSFADDKKAESEGIETRARLRELDQYVGTTPFDRDGN